MKQFLMILTALLMTAPAMAKEFEPRAVTITLQQDFDVNLDSGYRYYFTYIRNFAGKSGCSLQVTAPSPVLLKKGLTARGTLSGLEKEVREDADDLAKTGTTQFNFTADDKSFTAGVACFSGGFVFPTAGLPSMNKLLQMSRSHMTFNE